MAGRGIKTKRFGKPTNAKVASREIVDQVVSEADVVLIGIAVSNLIHNAFKYSSSREHPRIRIVAGRFPPGHWSISVSDNGIGIEPAQQDRLFKPFSRLDAAREFSGEGIGLTTVKRVLDKHHGQVVIASVPGEGTTVTLSVPIPTGTEGTTHGEREQKDE